MVATEEQLQKYHRNNFDQVNSAVKQIERATRSAVGRNDEPAVKHFTNVLMMMVAVKAEARLNQVLYVPDGLKEVQRRQILAESSLYDKWRATVDLAYRVKFSIPVNASIVDKLLHSDRARYETIVSFLADELQELIQSRNKLAHAQWMFPLNKEFTEVSPDLMRFMKTENCVTLFLRNEALDAMGNIISDLIQSQKLFQSRFDEHYKRVQKVQRKLAVVDYEKYKANLRRKHLHGLERLKGTPRTR